MITSVGWDAVSACASVRAGMSRPQEVESVELLAEETYEQSKLSAHPVDGFSEGFVLAGCWIRLALLALDDLAAYSRLPGPQDQGFWQRTGIFVAAPVLPAARFGDGGDDLVALREAYLNPLVRLWARPLAPSAMALVAGGNAAVAFALQQAMASLASGPIERAIILAADSYLDALSIEWLRDNRRLKTPENPVGLAPGEAAACILLESAAVARRRGARTEGVVRALAVGQEPRAFVKGEMSVGETLAQLLKSCAEQTKQPPPFTTHLIIDLNGEPWRAQELGAALPRVAQVWKPGRLLCPATSLGDTGAASGAVGICYGIRSMVRGAVAGPLLVVSSCVDGHVGVTCLDAARN